jgi:hypothetical protein
MLSSPTQPRPAQPRPTQPRPTQSRLSRNVATQIFSLSGALLDRLLLTGLMIRLWGIDVFADWSVLVSAAALFGVCDLGLQVHFLNVMQSAYVKADHATYERTYGIANVCYVLVGLAFALLIPAVMWLAPSVGWLQTTAVLPGEARWIFAGLACAAILGALRAPLSCALMARGRYPTAILIGTATFTSMVLASVVALGFGAGPMTIAMINLGCVGPLGTLGLWLADRWTRQADGLGPAMLFARPTRTDLQTTFAHSKWYAVQQVGPIVILQLPVALMSGFGVASVALAAFVLSRALVGIMRLITTVVSNAAGVEIAAVMHDNAAAAAWAQSQRIGWVSTVAVGAIGPALLVFGQRFVELWTGRTDVFDPGLTVLLLAPLIATIPLQQVSTHLQFASDANLVGRPRLMQLIATWPAAWLGLRWGGVHGLAIAIAAVEIFTQWWIVPKLAHRADYAGLVSYLTRCFFSLTAMAFASAGAALLALAISPWKAQPVLDLAIPAIIWLALIGPALFWTLDLFRFRGRLARLLK